MTNIRVNDRLTDIEIYKGGYEVALIKCSKCGKEYEETKELQGTETRCPSCKKKRAVCIIVGLGIVILFALYFTFSPKTVESGNGYKHQIGNFGACYYSDDKEYQCKKEATHRIKRPYSDSTLFSFCDEHWEEIGQWVFDDWANKDSDSSSSSKETDAKICAVKAVKDSLKVPLTAEFCSYSEMEATNLGGNKWKITGYVDAENTFGAMLREHWTVTLTLTDSGFTDYNVQFE